MPALELLPTGDANSTEMSAVRNLAFLEMIVGMLMLTIVAFFFFTSNFVQVHTYRWAIVIGLGFLVAGKVLRMFEVRREGLQSSMEYWWNIIYLALLFLGAFLIHDTDTLYEKTGAYLVIFSNIVDIAMTAYNYTQKKPNEADKKQTSKEINPMVPLALTVIGDLVIGGAFAYGVFKAQ